MVQISLKDCNLTMIIIFQEQNCRVNDLFDLTGKVAIVTGASKGLGKAISIGLAKAGANIVAISRDLPAVTQTANDVKELGKEALPLKVDVTQKEDLEKMIEQTIKKFSKIDILVNSAGLLKIGPSEEMRKEEFDQLINVNLNGLFLCSQAVGKQMIKQRSGSIINIAAIPIAGIANQSSFPAAVAYDSSKGGVIHLTKALAVEWAKYGVRVNAISPGSFETNLTKDFLTNPEIMDLIKRIVPMQRSAKPAEITGTAIFLASQASSYVTGHVLVVDGGWTAGF